MTAKQHQINEDIYKIETLTEHQQGIIILIIADAQIFLHTHYASIANLATILEHVNNQFNHSRLMLITYHIGKKEAHC